MTGGRRGAFIVLEGCDRTGKSTQVRLLVDFLKNRGIAVENHRFPARESNIGRVINDYLSNKQELNDQVIHLLFSSNRWEYMKTLREKLEAGITLVVDRYSYSGVAYSVAKGLSYDWCYSPERGLIKPDVVFYLKANPIELINRGKYGEERYETNHFQLKVSKAFESIYAENSSYWLPVNAAQTVDEVFKQIADHTNKILKTEVGPLKFLE